MTELHANAQDGACFLGAMPKHGAHARSLVGLLRKRRSV